ncbi:MAG: type II toxin-antitoxin system RelE/ParE family toxin, partial [Acidobacteria bacterium]|nr:type II toxin-antitoxin system RelE/ParE family toxin [Acidobacteriota bacterium]
MAETPWSLRIYATVDGRRPFSEWLDSLKDERGRDRIEARLSRIEFGNFGDCRAIGEGLSELRVDFGPGYRVY